MFNLFVNNLAKELTSSSALKVVSVVTSITAIASVPIVYGLSMLFGVEYTYFLFVASIIAPFLIAPVTVIIMIKLSRHLLYFKEALEEEIEKNKQQDLILFEQARFILMGEMMANISHQWKQPLNTTGLAIAALRTTNKTHEEMDKYFDIMEDNVHHLASTIDDFMSFFDKKTHSEMRDLESIVKEIKSVINAHIENKDIELEVHIDDSYAKIKIISSISQVILNLLNNAKDSFIGVATDKKIRLQLTTTQYGLEIECCDNGCGVNEKIKDKIFNPYFTTKEKQQGTGIGLYMTKEIVQKIFNGKIDVNSREFLRSSLHPVDNREKTCFYIAIPYSDNCVLQEENL